MTQLPSRLNIKINLKNKTHTPKNGVIVKNINKNGIRSRNFKKNKRQSKPA